MSDVCECLEIQAAACRRLGSNQYADLLDAMAGDHRRGGPMVALLDGRSTRPVHDALPLRLLGLLHRAALLGRAPELAARFPSCGGDGGEIELSAALAVIARLGDETDRALARGVQTNEVGRSLCHLAIANWLPTIGVGEFDWWEVGASAGLNLSFDRFAADTGAGILGSSGSPLTFPTSMFSIPPTVRESARCIERRGCDPEPIDPATDAVTLEAFVWPDQAERRRRLLSAVEITRPLAHRVDRASADVWIAERLAEPTSRTAIAFHSIVWQYMPTDVRRRFRNSLEAAGDAGRALVWARMEPAGPHADLRADVWLDGERSRFHLADVGYHGQDFTWLERRLSD